MELEDVITVTKINLQNEECYLMVGWQPYSFEMYLYTKENLWTGKFSPTYLATFSKNLEMTEDAYFTATRQCLSQENENYDYELKSGYFYWKNKFNESFVVEGFLPLAINTSPKNCQPDLIEVLLALNKYMKDKISLVKNTFYSIKSDYQKCLQDTEEFLNLKIEMEKALSDRFLSLLSKDKSEIEYFKDTENIDDKNV